MRAEPPANYRSRASVEVTYLKSERRTVELAMLVQPTYRSQNDAPALETAGYHYATLDDARGALARLLECTDGAALYVDLTETYERDGSPKVGRFAQFDCHECDGTGQRETQVGGTESNPVVSDVPVACCFCDGTGWNESVRESAASAATRATAPGWKAS